MKYLSKVITFIIGTYTMGVCNVPTLNQLSDSLHTATKSATNSIMNTPVTNFIPIVCIICIPLLIWLVKLNKEENDRLEYLKNKKCCNCAKRYDCKSYPSYDEVCSRYTEYDY